MLAQPVLLYDGRCAFCRRWVRRIRRWDRRGRILTVPADRRTGVPGLPVLSDASLDRAMHLALPDGTVLSGGDALRGLLRWLPGGFLPGAVLSIPGAQSLVNRAYEWVAARRHRFGCGDGVCGYLSGDGGDDADSRYDPQGAATGEGPRAQPQHHGHRPRL